MSTSSVSVDVASAGPRAITRRRRQPPLELPALDAQTVLSSDLFDTLITRTFLHPTELFAIAAAELRDCGLWPGGGGQWREKRAAVERELRMRKRGAEVTLSEIYQVIAADLGWTAEQADAAVAIEAAIEFRLTSPVRRNIAWFNAAARLVRHRIIICDTYFPRWMIERLVNANGIEIASEHIYLSSELGKTKAEGSVYPLILRKLPRLAGARMLHVGDSETSDVRNARSSGIVSFHITSTRLENGEIDLHRSNADPAEAAIAGATRAARLLDTGGDAHRRAVWRGACEIAGPLVTGFVLWTLIEARRRGLNALHFLARDGQIMCGVARRLLPLLDRSIECRYLYASRQALFLPSISAIDAPTVEWLLRYPAKTTLAGMLGRVELEPESCADALAESGVAADAGSLQEIGLDRVRALLSHSAISTRILSTAAERRRALLAYLDEVGFWSGGAAIVDVGWHGRLQLALGRALAAEGRLPPQGLRGFYLSLYQTPSDPVSGEFVPYIASSIGATAEEKYPNGSLVEVFFAADHGSLQRYECDQQSGRVECVLQESCNTAALTWGIDIQQAGILQFAEILVRNARALRLGPQQLLQALKPISVAALARFTKRPTLLEAETYGCFPHSEDQLHAEYGELAPRQAVGQVLASMLRPHRFPLHSLWREGTIRRSLPVTASGSVIDAFTGVAAAKRRVRSALGAIEKT